MLGSIFDYKDYQKYLLSALPTKGPMRGKRSELAKFLGCRPSHLTQVISYKTSLGIDMAYKCTEYFNFTKDESHFFLLLISKDRAGSYKLAEYYQEQIDEILKSRSIVKERLKTDDEISQIEKATYYSSWHYSVIHILCSLPLVGTAQDIMSILSLPRQKVLSCIEFLCEARILKNTDGVLQTTGRRIHLDSNSSMVSRHHANLRMKAIADLDHDKKTDLHFTSVYSFSKDDWNKLKEILLKSISSMEEVIRPSIQSTVGVVCIDFFEIK